MLYIDKIFFIKYGLFKHTDCMVRDDLNITRMGVCFKYQFSEYLLNISILYLVI